MHVSENDLTARAATRHKAEHRVHTLRRQIVRNSFPKEHRGSGRLKIRSNQCLLQSPLIEVELSIVDIPGEFWQSLAQLSHLPGKSIRTVRLENRSSIKNAKPVRAAIETGAQNHELGNVLFDGAG